MSNKTPAVVKKQPSGLRRFAGRFKAIGDIISELKKVVWPSRKEAVNLTIMVLIVCVVVGAILGAVDYGFFRLVNDLFLAKP
ncbi:MAG: preprotein translocase subunit SecE [Dehalococcoidia bacterium]|nr:preprotein translocase subunit SecE [Dehalococcoidia bacterium]MDZ4246502.1 preprotein translocase subunit SecE [Dehalococcoidia bacterium]